MRLVRFWFLTAAVFGLVVAAGGCKKGEDEVTPPAPAASSEGAPAGEKAEPASKPEVKTDGWKPFASEAGGFKVEMPGTPTHSAQDVPTEAGNVELHMDAVELAGGAIGFAVSYGDYSEVIAALGDKEKLLDGTRDGAARGFGGTVKWEKKIAIGDHPGREFELNVANQINARARIYVVRNRLFQLLVIWQEGQPTPDSKRFFESFVLDEKLATGPAPTSLEWKEFTSGKGGYKVKFPGEPEMKTESTDVMGQTVTFDLAMVTVDNPMGAFMSSYADFPKEMMAAQSVEKALDGARDGAVSKLEGKLLEETKETIGGHPARRFTFEAQGGALLVTARILLVDNRLYQVLALRPRNSKLDAELATFVDSFKLLK